MRKDALSLLRFLQICIHSSASVWFKCVCALYVYSAVADCQQYVNGLSAAVVACARVCVGVCAWESHNSSYRAASTCWSACSCRRPFYGFFPPNLFLPNNVYILISCGTQIWASCLVMHNWLGIKYVREGENECWWINLNIYRNQMSVKKGCKRVSLNN